MFGYGDFLNMGRQYTSQEEKHETESQRLNRLNEEKRKVAIEKLGTKWLLHPANRVKRITAFMLGN